MAGFYAIMNVIELQILLLYRNINIDCMYLRSMLCKQKNV